MLAGGSNGIPFAGLDGLGLELQSLKVLRGMGNPEITTSKSDIVGLIVGGLLGWYLAKRWPNFVIKGVGIVIGAELGVIVVRLIQNSQIAKKLGGEHEIKS